MVSLTRREHPVSTLYQGLRLCSPADYSGFPSSFCLFPSLSEEVRLSGTLTVSYFALREIAMARFLCIFH